MSNNINKIIVSLFKSFEDQKKYLKYAVVYSKMKFNDTYSLKMLKDIELNKNNIFNLSLFKNIENVKEDFEKMSTEKQQIFFNNINELQKVLKSSLFQQQNQHSCDNKCCKNDSCDKSFETITKNKKFKKIMKNKNLRNKLEQELSKQTGHKNLNLEDMLKSTMGDAASNPLNVSTGANRSIVPASAADPAVASMLTSPCTSSRSTLTEMDPACSPVVRAST